MFIPLSGFFQSCHQANIFPPSLACGLAWSSLIQPGGQSAVDSLVSWPGLAWTGLACRQSQANYRL